MAQAPERRKRECQTTCYGRSDYTCMRTGWLWRLPDGRVAQHRWGERKGEEKRACGHHAPDGGVKIPGSEWSDYDLPAEDQAYIDADSERGFKEYSARMKRLFSERATGAA